MSPSSPSSPRKIKRHGQGFATASMVIGIIALVTLVGGLILGLLAMILGWIAVHRGGLDAKSATGLITGALAFVIGIVFAMFMWTGFAFSQSADSAAVVWHDLPAPGE